MADSLPIAQAHELVPPEENLIGQFSCYTPAPIWFYFFMGPLYNLFIQPYLVSISESKLRFSKLNYWGSKIESTEAFDYDEIASIKMGRFIRLATLRFKFTNGNEIKLRTTFLADIKKFQKGKMMTQNMADYLQSRIAVG